MTFAAPAFDPSRAILRTSPLEPLLVVQTTQLLRESLAHGEIPEETSLQVVDIEGEAYGFITRELLLFDVARGETNGLEWIVTFCLICNSGALFSAKISDTTYHFTAGGIYNAMAILRDIETGSYWDLITGLCLHGELAGKQLRRFATLRHMRAKDALVAYPTLQLASLPISAEDKKDADEEDEFRRAARPEWSTRLANTLTYEDSRLPRLDMGLGIWTPRSARYYPIITLNATDNLTLDTLEGHNLLVYIDPESRIPDAFYTDASEAHWYGETLLLNNGMKVLHGAVFDAAGNLVRVERPLQLFQRWYGFAVMFRECEIFGVKNEKALPVQ
jgi:hypothetical protein